MEKPEPNETRFGKPALIAAGITIACLGALIFAGGG
jgi:hypothetical protein